MSMIPMAASIPFMTVEGIKCVKPPNLKMPSKIWTSPATATDKKNISILPSSVIAEAQIAVSPAAGPLTLMCDLLIRATTIPPIIPAIKPAYSGALDAREMPRQSGRATKKTVILALKSCFKKERK